MSEESNIDVHERFLIERLEELRQAYMRDAKPYVDQLAAIRSMRAPPTYMVNLSELAPEFAKQLAERIRSS